MSEELEALLRTLTHDVPADAPPGATWGSSISAATLPSPSAPRPRPAEPAALPQLELAAPAAVQGGGAELTPVELLGVGGMGQVLMARQSSLRREVAVKVLKPEAGDGEARALIDEAQIAGALEHPGVVPIYALARDARGFPAVVMKRVEGTSWAELLRDPEHAAWARVAPVGKDRLEVHVGILVQVCNALAFAHRRGVLHRDVKPGNVLLGELGEVFLADWGVAMRKGAGGPARLVGTPAYMAPEMVRGQPAEIDERSDVYLLGATLFEILAGVPPHAGQTISEVLRQAWRGETPALPAGAPPELAALCTKALAREPGDRPEGALAVRDGLLLFLQHRGSVRLTESALGRLAGLQSAFASPSSEDAKRGYTLLSECLFAFNQALGEWPENEAARKGRQKALTTAVDFELRRGNTDAARSLLNELPDPPPALRDEVARQEEARRARQARTLELERQARQNDPKISARERNRFLVVLAVASSLSFGVLELAREALGALLGEWVRLVPATFFLAVLGGGVLLNRRTLLATRVNRQLIGVIALGAVGVAGVDVITIIAGVPQYIAAAVNGLLGAYGLASISIFTHRSFLLPAGVFLGAGAMALVVRERPALLFMLSGTMAFLVAAIAWRSWRRAVAAEGSDGGR